MKKMLEIFGADILSRGEMKNVVGGGNCCTSITPSGCNGVCGPGGGVCGWQAAMPLIGLAAGCVCDHSSGGNK